MDVNPYAALQAPLEDLFGAGRGDLEARKASRGQRLGAALLDGLCLLIMIAPFVIQGIAESAGRGGRNVDSVLSSMRLPILFCLLLCAIAVVNSILLHRNGQTIGKRALGIKVVRTNGDRMPLGRYVGLRFLPLNILGRVPMIEPLLTLVDCLLISGSERRCLHGISADTIVINE